MRNILAYCLYFSLGIVFFGFYAYRINPDGVSYFTIAQNYSLGIPVINGFWSPLLSWLLIPFFLFKISPFYAFNSIQLLIGYFILIAIQKLASTCEITETNKAILLYCSIPLILYATYAVISPDLLSLCLLLFYFNSVLTKKVNGYHAGFFGALGYLAKSYVFFFFLIHFTLLMVYKKEKKALITGLGVFFAISGIWIGLISFHYHHVTISNAGSYNFQDSRPGGVTHPFAYDGLIQPEEHAGNSWYDPSFMYHAYHKPQTTRAEVTGWGKVLVRNLLDIGYQYEGFSLFAIVILLYYAKRIKNPRYFIPLATFFIFSAGYVIYHIEDRYIWFSTVLLLIMAASMKTKKVYTVILLLSFVFLPIKRLVANVNDSKDIYLLSKKIQVQGNIASNGEWNNSLFIAYYHNAKYYGIPNGTPTQMLTSLQKNHISYYLLWSDAPRYRFLKQLHVYEKERGITVYQVTP